MLGKALLPDACCQWVSLQPFYIVSSSSQQLVRVTPSCPYISHFIAEELLHEVLSIPLHIHLWGRPRGSTRESPLLWSKSDLCLQLLG